MATLLTGRLFFYTYLHMPEHLMADIPQKIFLEHEGRVLLTHDIKGNWQPPGGRLNVGEESEAGLRREIREELGVEVELKGVIDTFVFTSASGLAHYVVIHLAAPTGPLSELKPNPSEIAELRWFGPGEFGELKMLAGYKEALRKHFHARTPRS